MDKIRIPERFLRRLTVHSEKTQHTPSVMEYTTEGGNTLRATRKRITTDSGHWVFVWDFQYNPDD